MTGSLADHLTLSDRLEQYDRAERIAALLGCEWSGKFADAAHDALTRQAIACGLDLKDGRQSIVDWARQRTATFNATFRRVG